MRGTFLAAVPGGGSTYARSLFYLIPNRAYEEALFINTRNGQRIYSSIVFSNSFNVNSSSFDRVTPLPRLFLCRGALCGFE